MTVIKRISDKLLSSSLPLNDHRAIGQRQKLFFFHKLSQGSCFFQPRGAHIYNKLIEFLRAEYKIRNYHEVITPNIYNCDLWRTSGHWEHYEKNMIKFNLSDEEFSLKPMNCPGHCLMFKHRDVPTSDQLPIRWADFGVLHRNELSGSLIGLSRLRKFQQDDAHIFCRPDQVESEIKGCLDFAKEVYKKFNFNFDLKLSLRPECYLGESEQWDKAEEALRKALNATEFPWSEQKFEGAFYGPKIDLEVKDQFNRSQQCATIQLDFQLPERFDLIYKTISEDGTKKLERPVMIHRAIFGSVERFIAMIAENCNGRWPFWMSPLQAQVIPVHSEFDSYAESVCEKLRRNNFWADCDLRSNVGLNGKVREAHMIPYYLILVVGKNEASSESVTVRLMKNQQRTDESIKENDQQQQHSFNVKLETLIKSMKQCETKHDLRLPNEVDFIV